jgi:hypothetical protein
MASRELVSVTQPHFSGAKAIIGTKKPPPAVSSLLAGKLTKPAAGGAIKGRIS